MQIATKNIQSHQALPNKDLLLKGASQGTMHIVDAARKQSFINSLHVHIGFIAELYIHNL